MKENGFDESKPIWIYEDQILDGNKQSRDVAWSCPNCPTTDALGLRTRSAHSRPAGVATQKYNPSWIVGVSRAIIAEDAAHG